MAKDIRPSDELLAAPLPDLIRDLGLAVAKANEELVKIGQGDWVYTIPEGEIELKVAISVNKERTGKAEVGGGLYGFNMNASYSSTYGFKEEAASRIRLTLRACPRNPQPPAPDPPVPDPQSPPDGARS